MPVFRMLFCQQQLKRDLYESWLIMFIALFVRWNRFRQLVVPPLDGLRLLRDSSDYRLAEVLFGIGLLAFILPFRCYWVQRCQHRVQLLMLAAEMVILLRIIEFNDNVVWQPFLGIYRDMFETMGRNDYWFYQYAPGMAIWLVSGRAFESFQLLLSFGIFVAGINNAAEEWMRTVDLLLLGHEPAIPCPAWRRHYREFQRQDRCDKRYPPKPSPEHLMYRRLCHACIQE
ncbi:hypothetical protein KR200_003572, partial [Drosophila serrata]